MAEWLAHLMPDGIEDTSPLSGTQDALSAASRDIGKDAALWAVQAARRVFAAVDEESRLAAEPFYAGEPERQVCESCILAVLVAINQDLPPGLMTLPPEASHIARLWARQGKPLEVLLRKAWASHKHVQDEIFGVFETHGPEVRPMGELRALGRTLFAFTEFVVREMSINYGDEQSRWQGRLAAARRRVFDIVVSGEHPPADAERVLRLDFNWCHLMAVTLPTGRGYAPDHDAALDRYVRDVGDALGASTAFTLEQPDGGSVLVWSSPTSFDSRFVEILRSLQKPEWLQVAVGCSGKGIDGFRECHRTARLAAQVVELSRNGCVRAYGDVRLLALLVSDPDAAKTFAAEVLGTLAHDDPKLKDIRQTLRLYLGSGRSRIAAAEALHLAPNTVAYRVKRAEELLERPVGDRTLETLVALELLEELPRLAALGSPSEGIKS